MNKLQGLLRLIRPINCVMMGLAVLTGEILAYGTLYFPSSIFGFITAFTLTGASMITNDYWDRSVDAVNAPHRPIPSGVISPQIALWSAFTLIVLGMGTAVGTNLACVVLATFSITISLLYNYWGKKLGLWGNFMVSLCIAIPLIYGGFLSDHIQLNIEGLTLLLLFDLTVFFAITGREVNKDIVDVEGDTIRAIQTVAIRYGSKTAATLASLFYLTAVVLSILPWGLKLTSWVYLLLVSIADVGFIISAFILLRDYSKENAKKVKNMVLFWMLIALLAFLTGGIIR
ncbi:MAG: geranylgeranylglycerol-phosphate geranylgeranyltransferase [Candidatus Bathyarchaeota archaeon]|nr:MAG: geranylgeranylglycerol-phosphate geranylgeranyltransferase [Candidatus Bathyarchaeota archaeon]